MLLYRLLQCDGMHTFLHHELPSLGEELAEVHKVIRKEGRLPRGK